MPPRVSFLICGSQKSGTSALDRYLRRHPQLFLPTEKELHFFDDETQDWTKPNLQEFHQHFEAAKPNQLCGEATPITMYWDAAPERVWRYNPKMKMIALLRDPVTRAYSHWAMETARNAESLSFHEAVTQEHKRAAACRPLQDRVHSYRDRGFYSSQIRRLWRLFGTDNVLVLQQNWLERDPLSCINKICEHLGVDPMQSVQPIRERIGQYETTMDEATRSILQQQFRAEVQQIEQMLGWDCSEWLEGWL
ncbi:sulfotransferase [Synechococcus sp. N26]|uniref:sulfotransferase family protein n=1 Tax=Synechococcus sp. N26 TaxID=2575513 RepID=UPI000E0E236C|nr:sulfotransferase [Synechococcus sp. N26]